MLIYVVVWDDDGTVVETYRKLPVARQAAAQVIAASIGTYPEHTEGRARIEALLRARQWNDLIDAWNAYVEYDPTWTVHVHESELSDEAEDPVKTLDASKKGEG